LKQTCQKREPQGSLFFLKFDFSRLSAILDVGVKIIHAQIFKKPNPQKISICTRKKHAALPSIYLESLYKNMAFLVPNNFFEKIVKNICNA
jgi:hypothetical protein